jgi:preprotein translocase subunit Sss1
MNPEAGKLWFQIALFITFVSVILLPFQKPDTAEFVITVTTLAIGLLFIGLIALIVRRGSR